MELCRKINFLPKQRYLLAIIYILYITVYTRAVHKTEQCNIITCPVKNIESKKLPKGLLPECLLIHVCVCVISVGPESGAGQSRWNIKVSPEEAAVCACHRSFAEEDWSHARRPAADGSWLPSNCGKRQIR